MVSGALAGFAALPGCGAAGAGGAGVGAVAGGGAGAGAGAARGAGAVAAFGPDDDGHHVQSNVTRADYAGSAACRSCHEAEWRAWQASAMHQMTRVAGDAATRIEAPFDGRAFHFKGDAARLETRGGARWMSFVSSRYGAHEYEVTRVIGGHHREDFVGTEGGRADADEVVLPVSFLLATRTFRYKGYSVMVRERDGLRAGPVWNRTCILCHNTAPYLLSMLGPIAGKEARPYQGEVVDPLLPRDRRWSFDVTDARAFAAALAREAKGIGGRLDDDTTPPPAAALAAIASTRNELDAKGLVEVGIGCESCHGGARAHVDDPRVLPSLEPRAPFLRASPARRLDATARRAQAINRTCARCHQVLFTGYPWTWEGGERRGGHGLPPGGANINSGEARDFLLGACSSAMTCVDCHDPHVRESGGRVARLDTTVEGDRVCTRCHAELASDERLRAHAHHDPAGAGGRCLGCHMPKKNMSLDGALTRYHRIGSPTDAVRVEKDRPLECALCHTDKSVRAILADVERLWGKRYDEGALLALYGDLDENALVATLKLGKPHEKAVAMARLGSMGPAARRWADLVAPELTDEYPILRGYAERALEAMLGTRSPIDLSEDDAHITERAKAWLAAR